MDNFIEKIAEAPAVALDTTVENSIKLKDSITRFTHVKKATAYWKLLGPGLTTGAADDDPSGIATYSQAGAAYGFSLLWLSLFSFPFMAMVQEMCARIGIVTGRGLAANIRRHYPRWVLYSCTMLLFFANTVNVGADLGAMAKATQLLAPSINFGILVIGFTLLSLLLQVFTSYGNYAKYLKWLALILLSYVLSSFLIQIDWSEVAFAALVPSITPSKDQIILICAILGTTISPYLFFWQTSQEVEEEILEGKKTLFMRTEDTSNKTIKNMQVDVWSGMFLSNLVMFFIIVLCGATLNSFGITDIQTAEQAALALKPLAGDNAYLLFTLGIIGTGMLAVPVLSGAAAYALSESFNWKVGLYRELKHAYAFYGVIILSMVIGLLTNFIGIDPIKILIYTAVINGLIAPIILFLIVQLSSNEKIMGKWVNSELKTALGFLITIIMAVVGIATIISFLM